MFVRGEMFTNASDEVTVGFTTKCFAFVSSADKARAVTNEKSFVPNVNQE